MTRVRSKPNASPKPSQLLSRGDSDSAAVAQKTAGQLHDSQAADRTYRLLMDQMTDGALIASADGLVLYANRSMAAMLKVPLDLVTGTHLLDWVEAEGVTRASDLLEPLHADDRRREVYLKARDGTQLPVYLSASELPGFSGLEAVGIVATDLSEQYKRTAELAISETAARELLAASDRSRLALLSLAEDQHHTQEALRLRSAEMSRLYDLSRALAITETLDDVLSTTARHAVDDLHVTCCRIALLDNDDLVIRAAHPIRVLEHDLQVGGRYPLMRLPHCRAAVQQGKPVLLNASEPGLTPDELSALMLDAAASVLLVPMQVGSGETGIPSVLGVLLVSEARSPAREPLSNDKIRLAQGIADQAATAIRRSILRDQTDKRLRHVVALHTIHQAISGSLDLQLVFGIILDQGRRLLGVDALNVLLIDPGTQVLESSAAAGFRTDARARTRVRLGQDFGGTAALERRPARLPDLIKALGDSPRRGMVLDEHFVSYFAVPLQVKGALRGLLEAYHRSPMQMDQETFDFLEALAGQTSLAIENLGLLDHLRRSTMEMALAYEGTLESWAAALDLRERTQGGKSSRLAQIAVQLGSLVGISGVALTHLHRGAILHDIGHLGIPESILLKPGPLSPDEWERVRLHPTIGRELLSPVVFLKDSLEIPWCHHERWDGSGYPRGLRGKDIPLAARVFAVLDVWDSMTADRPYRHALENEEALEFVRSQSGQLFDPAVVKAFLDLAKSL